MSERSLYLVAYDVTDDKRRRQILKIVRSFASGGQKSAYECWLSKANIREIANRVRVVFDEDEDRFAAVPLDPRRIITTLGCALMPSDPDFLYFG